MNTLEKINSWHKSVNSWPRLDQLTVQAGCHAEEFAEMLRALRPSRRVEMAIQVVEELATAWKSGNESFLINDRAEMLDALADQIVTAVGVGHCARMQIVEACERVNDSNYSKFEDGKPVFDQNGKVRKGKDYYKVNLEGLH